MAALLLLAAFTSGIPPQGTPAPNLTWAAASVIASIVAVGLVILKPTSASQKADPIGISPGDKHEKYCCDVPVRE